MVVILSIVAMCTNHVGQGIALLVSGIASAALCSLVFFALIIGTVGSAFEKASRDAKLHPINESPISRPLPVRPR